MLTRKSPAALLSGSLVPGVLVIACLLIAYNKFGGETYHPPATHQLRAAERALDTAGFKKSEAIPLAQVMSPTFVGDESLATGTWLSHSVRDSTKRSTVHASVAIVGEEHNGQSRPPLNIAVVFDRSGSMVGEKMDFAKLAGHALIDALGPEDRISIVSYSSDVQTHSSRVNVVDDRTRAELHAAIRKIEAAGNTNLSGGFERGRDLVLGGKTANSINRVILLSDGQANAGVTDVRRLRDMASSSLELGVSLTTMGVGVDYDENLMNTMAVSGAGNYYFIENGYETGTVLSHEFDRLQSAVARNTRLLLEPRAGVTIIDVVGFEHERHGEGVTVSLDAFSASQRKDVLFELDVTAEAGAALFDSELVYSDVEFDRIVRRKDTARVTTQPGVEKIEPAMAMRLQQIATTEAFDQAMDLYERGDRHAAADLIDEQREANQKFLDDQGITDAAFTRVDRQFAELAESMRRLNRRSVAAKSMVKKFHEANASVKGQVVF